MPLSNTEEYYSGVKFHCQQKDFAFAATKTLKKLNFWAWLFKELGLAPAHPTGAYGNFSSRTEQHSFLISASGMMPKEKIVASNYCLVTRCDEEAMFLEYCGVTPPSSETLLHHLIYRNRSDVGAILHGHNNLLLKSCKSLCIASTQSYYDYGTKELAAAASELAIKEDFFILKDHGFVALGKDLNAAGQTTLHFLQKLIALYQS